MKQWLKTLVQSLPRRLILFYIFFPAMRGSNPPFEVINPWRDLPSDPAVHAALRDVLYANNVLQVGMSPTSLPDEDDYSLYSGVLRSLEIRSDITYLVLEETGIGQTVMSLANRGGKLTPIPDEPMELQPRLKALYMHWHEWQLMPEAPHQQLPMFDTTIIPPLMKTGDSGETTTTGSPSSAASIRLNSKSGKFCFTQEQATTADQLYASYRSRRDHAVSYLKRHPPQPMALIPVQRDAVSSGEVWESLLTDTDIQADLSVSMAALNGNVRFRPIYRSLLTERVPFTWENPDQQVKKTDEEIMAEMEERDRRFNVVQARRKKQQAFQKALREERDRGVTDKTEL